MTKINEIYKCEVCGHIVEILQSSKASLICCGKPMRLQIENTVEASKEKHIPVVENTDLGLRIKIGEVEHPMIDNHYIEFIEVITLSKIYRKQLNPGDKPEAIFSIDEEILCVRAYCNIHGLWKA